MYWLLGGTIKDLAVLDPNVPGLMQPVHLVENRLVWPVTFLYPEHQTSDFVQEFYEDSTLVYLYIFRICIFNKTWKAIKLLSLPNFICAGKGCVINKFNTNFLFIVMHISFYPPTISTYTIISTTTTKNHYYGGL